jgi:hypothetical protein
MGRLNVSLHPTCSPIRMLHQALRAPAMIYVVQASTMLSLFPERAMEDCAGCRITTAR